MKHQAMSRTGLIPATRALGLPTVLLVEQDFRQGMVLRMALDTVAQVVEASNGDRALKILKERAIDIVLVDNLIQKPSGLDVLRLTRQQWPQIPLVIVTGCGSEQLAIEALRAGVKDYLKKPIDIGELRRVVLTHTRASCPPTDIKANCPKSPFCETSGISHSGICRALEFVKAHFTEAMTLSQIAAEAGLSKFHFCRLFRRHAGVPFREYVRGLRIDEAKVLLADRRLTVTEVAYATGFNDLSHFDNVFHNMAGLSPTAYRKAIDSI